jgi:hypothetical protein
VDELAVVVGEHASAPLAPEAAPTPVVASTLICSLIRAADFDGPIELRVTIYQRQAKAQVR